MNNYFYRMIYRFRNNISNTKNNYSNTLFMNDLTVPVNRNIGYLEISVSSQHGQVDVFNAALTVYAKQEDGSVPVYNEVIDGSVLISLPIAHHSGTLIRSPEYYFTTYDVKVEAEGYANYRCNNLRLFEGITTKLDVCMTPFVPGQYPIPENIVNIPPHPRDQLDSQRYK